MANIEPKILKGFRDFLPEKQIPRARMIQAIKASYEAFGFEPLETPVLEYAEVLTGKYGDEGDKLMYRFKDNGGRDVAMRYDLTIPLARVVAMNGELKKPFKRYQIAPVWRADNTQKGRFREFYQCDADIVGPSGVMPDAEILALSASTLRKLGVGDFEIRVNSREAISGFYAKLGLGEKESSVAMRAVDKIDKIGREGVREELIKGGVAADKAEQILAFAATKIQSADDVIAVGRDLGIGEECLSKLADTIKAALVLEAGAKFVVDFSIARGLDYYTGMIFETSLAQAPQFGSVLSGGRYDGLVGTFSNRPVPAVGLSIGLDRLYAALEELGLVKDEKTVARALVVNFDSALQNEYLKLASELRGQGVNTVLYFDTADLKKQLSYASDKGIRFAVIYGSEEQKKGKVVVKDLSKGSQEEVGWGDVASLIKRG